MLFRGLAPLEAWLENNADEWSGKLMVWDTWNIVVLAVASYASIMILVRMMLARRNQLWLDWSKEIAAAQRAAVNKPVRTDEAEAAVQPAQRKAA